MDEPTNITPNTLLRDLLDLQQDGSSAISAPHNWMKEPLFYTRTEVDRDVDEAIKIIRNQDSKEGVWLFFIGSPGNGKSALTGRIIRELFNDGFSFFEPDFKGKHDEEGKYDFERTGQLPYILDVYNKPGETYSICSFVQDASVVKNRFSKNIVPAKDLIETCIDCFKRGKSLIVCANRGVIEDIDRIKGDYQGDDLEIVKQIITITNKESTSFDPPPQRNQVNSKLRFKKISLENKSLLHQSGIFESLVISACKDSRWDKCNGCSNKEYCPFYQNKTDLQSNEYRESFLSILKQYESYSGQTLVFREAIALLSFILAGLTDDYIKFAGNPCLWVNSKVEVESWHELIGRRIYISIYKPYNPLLSDSEIVKDILNEPIVQDLVGTKKINKLSLNTGLVRFFGQNGIAKELHPSKNVELSLDFMDISINGLTNNVFKDLKIIRSLELKCFTFFDKIEEGISDSKDFISRKIYNPLRRWGLNYFIHIYCFSKGLTRFTTEFEALFKLSNSSANSSEIIKIKKKIGESLEELLHSGEVELNKNTSVQNLNINLFIQSYLEFSDKDLRNPLGVYVKFDQSKGDPIFIDGKTFCFLLNKTRLKLSNLTFPAELIDQLKYQQNMIARQSNYNLVEKTILKVKTKSSTISIEKDIYGQINITQ